MRKKGLECVCIIASLSIASLTLAQAPTVTGQTQSNVSSTPSLHSPIDSSGIKTTKDSTPALLSSPAFSKIISDSTKQSSATYYFPKYTTDWRCYLDVYGISASIPVQFDVHLLKFVFAYKFIGFGTKAFNVYAKIPFNKTFADSHKLVAFYAPLYLYYIPFASNRPTGDVTPFATYFYIGGSSLGMKGAKLFDVGIGASMYVWDFTFGYNAISADSRNPFVKPDSSDGGDNSFHDYPVSWGSFYASVTISSGSWLSASSKLSKKIPSAVKKPIKSAIPDTLNNK